MTHDGKLSRKSRSSAQFFREIYLKIDSNSPHMQVEMTEKVYCCGNSAQREVSLISKFDLVVSAIILIVIAVFASIIAGSPEKMKEMSENTLQSNQTDIASFMNLPGEAQGGIFVGIILPFLFGIAMAILLFIGARKRRRDFLLLWFISSLSLFVLEIVGLIIFIAYSYNQTFWSCVLVIAMLYKWYCFWIVKVLMREIRTVGEGYRNPLDSIIEPESNSNAQELDKF